MRCILFLFHWRETQYTTSRALSHIRVGRNPCLVRYSEIRWYMLRKLTGHHVYGSLGGSRQLLGVDEGLTLPSMMLCGVNWLPAMPSPWPASFGIQRMRAMHSSKSSNALGCWKFMTLADRTTAVRTVTCAGCCRRTRSCRQV